MLAILRRDRAREMSEEGDTFWVNLTEKFFGLIIVILGALLIYFTATTTNNLGAFSWFFGVVSAIMLIIGLFLLLVRAPE
jgi:predicted phage tail protein